MFPGVVAAAPLAAAAQLHQHRHVCAQSTELLCVLNQEDLVPYAQRVVHVIGAAAPRVPATNHADTSRAV
ncbi:hypothetical protein EYF80_032478 [Liparis tanakae]|uniref:Uncharacterized protein n=1 Tax=Liparis tanakae TaxID=230148 RepID=A0A4Z2GV21_9TELE|nr:hypothetical protein EYF80_032478 [Liparis tanakae]